MSAVAPIIAGALQHTPSQPLPPQTPSQSSMNAHPSTMHALVSSDSIGASPLLRTGNHNPVMIQAQAQAQQRFRQRQLLAYQQQQQLRLQQQQQQQQQQQLSLQPKQSPPQVQTPPQELHSRTPATEQQNKDPVEQDDDPQPQPELLTKTSSTGLTPIQTNDIMLATTPMTTPTLTPGSQTFLKNTKRPGLNKRHLRKHSTGHAVLRLLQFAEQLDPGDQALQRAFWDGFISDFFTKSSKTKLGLRNSDTDEQRPFYISHYSVAKFFHTLYECGVASIQLTLEQTMEFILPGGHMNVECPRANFIYRYNNGTLVSSTGHLWVRFSLTPDRIWKIKYFEFACQRNEEFVSRSHLVLNKDGSKLKKSSKNILPESPINQWGIPSKAFHILQMMDAAVQLDDVIFYSLITGTTAKESLASLAFNMEQQQTKDAILTNSTTLDTPDPPASPGEPNVLTSPSPGTSKAKTNKKPPSTRRKSLKNGKSIKQEQVNDADPNEQQQQESTVTKMENFSMTTSNTPTSPIVKTQSGYPIQQQQQQAFFQQQRKMLIEQQAYLQQRQSQLLQFQDQQLLPRGHTSSPLPSGLTLAYQQPQQPSSTESLGQTMSYPPLSQTYPGSFGSQPQQQVHELDDFTQSPKKQFRKRSDSISENKKSSVSRKKGKTTTSSK